LLIVESFDIPHHQHRPVFGIETTQCRQDLFALFAIFQAIWRTGRVLRCQPVDQAGGLIVGAVTPVPVAPR
jgi:hypothetical protein